MQRDQHIKQQPKNNDRPPIGTWNAPKTCRFALLVAALRAQHTWQEQIQHQQQPRPGISGRTNPTQAVNKRQANSAKDWLYQQCCRVQLVLLLTSGAARVQGRKQERSDAGTQPSCGCATTAHGYAERSVKEGLCAEGNVSGEAAEPKGRGTQPKKAQQRQD